MTLENEFIAPNKKAVSDEPEKKPKKKQKKIDYEKGSWVEKFSFRWNTKKFTTIFGMFVLFFSFYTFLACISYLFTWQEDQSRVLGKSFWEFMFESNVVEVANWIGKIGAWLSHLLIFRWFGLAAFAIPFILLIFGVKLLANFALLPIKSTSVIALVWMVWGSMFLGYFSNFINFVGGSFGFYVNHWLTHMLGSFGAFLMLMVALYAVIVTLHNPNFGNVWEYLYQRFSSQDEEEETEAESLNSKDEFGEVNELRIQRTVVPDDSIYQEKKADIEEVISEYTPKPVAPVIVPEVIEEVNPFIQVIEEEEDIRSMGEEMEFDTNPVKKVKTTSIPEFSLETDYVLELPTNIDAPIKELEEEIEEEIEEEFLVEIPADDEELTDNETDRLRQEYGDYDPTLDLPGYLLPSIDLLRDWGGGNEVSVSKQELEDNKNKIVETLMHYKIEIAKIKATVGPTVTLYEIVPAPGVRISKIKNLEDDIALSLSALGIRIIAPIPGKGTIGIEVPNSNPQMVSMRSLIASEKFQNSDYELPVVLGKTITNETYTFDLTKMPHLLVAGSTGQGKSVGLNAILVSILYKKHPAQVKFVLVDPKKVELTLYNRIERHFLAKLPGEEDAIITDTSKVVNTLNSLCIEMDDRYGLLKDAQVRTIKEYNAKFIARRLNPENGHRYLPYIVVLIDEFADLIMTAGKEVEHPIARIAQLARAIGIHLIVATQRPSVNVITGMIKANFPARIAFRVLSKIDSRTILDTSGADQLIGRGDMLISTGSDTIRLQCGFVDTPEVEEICAFIGNQRAYPDALLLPEYTGEGGNDDGGIEVGDVDPMFADAARIVVMHQQGSASLLQRKLKLGYNRAGRIVDQLEAF
ncbi:MAG: DNA translocase FtsK, partial [Chitinophagia bacterium]|nr:DNA translocase FtsK [Chitinophagia bacterium]